MGFFLQQLTTPTLALLACVSFAHADDISFARDVRPILSDKCFHCHGPDESTREADLRFDQKGSVLADRDGNPVIKPGDLDHSGLIHRIMSSDEDEIMPPPEMKKPLSPEEIEILQKWVASGAKWSKHWAFEKPVRHETPSVKQDDWASNWIDQFVLARLEKEGIPPAADADVSTLLRRVSFDLTGLPPNAEMLAQLTADPSAESFAKIVDQLLESPHYGERMATYWLDLVRYADTVGYHGDQDHNIYPYRDWVIDAFNSGMPFDQFTREQLAGDLLDNPTVQQRTATGYNRLLQTTHEGGLQKAEYRAIYAADRVRNVSAVWMGATVGCAQCHDHKFDPYTAKDFYSLAAFFDDIDDEQHFGNGTNALPTRREPELKLPTADHTKQLAELDSKIKRLKAKSVEEGLSEEERKIRKAKLDKAIAARRKVDSSVPRSMITVALQQPRTTRILPRGNWLDDTGPVVNPAVPEFLDSQPAAGHRLSRLDLANWFVDAKHGNGLFTARVMVNRLWYLFLGSGLAADLDDFGGQGKAPIHPELLDRLAHELVDSHWDIKGIIRQMIASRTYRQSSVATPELRELDPLNQWYARQSAFRLPAEMVRDNALAISGLLRTEVGGPSVKPYQPIGYYRHLNFPTRKYHSHQDDRQWRRGLYVHWQRQFLHPMMKAFDAPSREECTAQRTQSNTPIAALTLLNDPTFVEAARAFAARCLDHKTDSDAERCRWAFQVAETRSPSPQELEILTTLLQRNRKLLAQSSSDAAEITRVGISEPNTQFEASELAAWTAVCRAILNLAETNTRN
ncbi:MAG: PSD1 and planctomycete cytochrome C domain-containing protein [Fuerstiella sp.]